MSSNDIDFVPVSFHCKMEKNVTRGTAQSMTYHPYLRLPFKTLCFDHANPYEKSRL